MELSVVIISWNSRRYVQPCLDALFRATEGIEWELVWVDNGSTDQTKALLEPYLARVRSLLIPLTQNLGVARARNLGIQRSSGRLVLLLDVDTQLTAEALRAMMADLKAHPDCGLCGCKLIDAASEVQMSCRRYPSAGERPFEVEYLIGACQLIRRELFERIGLLDGRIFFGPEDADFCLRAHQAGWSVRYLPGVSFRHDYQRTTGKRLFSRQGWMHIRSLFYFYFKHLRL